MTTQQQQYRVPLHVRDFYKDENRPVRLFDRQFGNNQQFGKGVFFSDYAYGQQNESFFRNKYPAPYGRRETGLSELRVEKDRFFVQLDMQHFTADEISVRTFDGYLHIDGLHEEREDEYGFVQRRFSRKYFLPDGVETEHFNAYYSTDGVVFVTGPRQNTENQTRFVDRQIPLTQTGQPSTTIQQQQQLYAKKK